MVRVNPSDDGLHRRILVLGGICMYYRWLNEQVVMVFACVGLKHPSMNAKTGDMTQQYVFYGHCRPIEAHFKGLDAHCCLKCPLRVLDVCYVSGGSGICRRGLYPVDSIYKHFVQGRYQELPEVLTDKLLRQLAVKPFRFGEYGEPVLYSLENSMRIARVTFHTGFTHAWREVDAEWAKILMASVETEEGRELAHEKGYRTARIINSVDEIQTGEELCPFQKDRILKGKPAEMCRHCNTCHKCFGHYQKGRKSKTTTDICFLKHGVGGKNFPNSSR